MRLPMKGVVGLLVPIAIALAGCARVEPWDRDVLARPDMQLVADPIESAADEHIYFSKEKHGTGTVAAAADALVALQKGASDEAFGDPFLHGFDFTDREQDDVIAAFGPEFAKDLAVQPVGGWLGPVASSYGLHLVRVESRMEPRAAKFDEVRITVARDLNDERRRTTNQEVFERLRERNRSGVCGRDEGAGGSGP